MPLGRIDLLKSPDHFPHAEYRYTLKDLTVVWYMYGGKDFGTCAPTEQNIGMLLHVHVW